MSLRALCITKGAIMTLTDVHYRRLVTKLVDQHAHTDTVERAFTETAIQVALCQANIYPESSEEE
jgi:murein endopeptidase